MKAWIKDYLKIKLYRLVFKSRSGYLSITEYAQKRMIKYQLTDIDIEDAWRWGNIEESKVDKYIPNKKTLKVVRRFEIYNVVLIVIEEDGVNTLTNCWRYDKIKWLMPKVYK